MNEVAPRHLAKVPGSPVSTRREHEPIGLLYNIRIIPESTCLRNIMQFSHRFRPGTKNRTDHHVPLQTDLCLIVCVMVMKVTHDYCVLTIIGQSTILFYYYYKGLTVLEEADSLSRYQQLYRIITMWTRLNYSNPMRFKWKSKPLDAK